MGEFLMLVENHAGQAGPRWELSEVLERLERLRRLERKLGYAEDELTYLYDFPAWSAPPAHPPKPIRAQPELSTCGAGRVVDNCAGNRGESGGLLVMVEIVRRIEYNYLKDVRANIGKYVGTVTVSCQHHNSNLFEVHCNRKERVMDETEPDPFDPSIGPAPVPGNKTTESWVYNRVRFLAGNFKKYKEFRAFMRSEYGDSAGIAPIKSARFWAVRALRPLRSFACVLTCLCRR